jgi:putative ABC transport system permease protein
MADSIPSRTRARAYAVSYTARLITLAAALALLMAASGVNIGAIGQGLGLALVGMGVYVSFRILNFPDLSVDGSFPLGGAAAAALIVNYGISAEWTLFAALAAGALLGLCTALIHVLFKIDGLLASIIVMTGAYTITLRVMTTSNIPLINQRTILTPYQPGVREWVIANFGTEARRFANNLVEIAVFSLVVIVILLIVRWFLRTEIGLTLRAAGKNAQMVRAVGVDHRLMIVIGLMLSNGLAGLAGALTVQQLGFADVQMGVGIIVRGLAAVMIGETLLRPRTIGQGIFAAVIGMIAFEVLRAWVFAALRLEAADIRLMSAVVVLIALAAPGVLQNIVQRRKSAHMES